MNIETIINSSYYTLIKDVISTGVPAVMLVIAWRGLDTWKKELHGKNKYKAAFDLFVAVENLYDKIDSEIRSSLPRPSEINADLKWELEEYKNRLNQFYEYKRSSYNPSARRAEILFEGKMKDLIEKLNETITEMRYAYQACETYLWLKKRGDDDSFWKKKAQDGLKLLRSGGNKKNDYTIRLKKTIDDIEEFLHPYLKGKNKGKFVEKIRIFCKSKFKPYFYKMKFMIIPQLEDKSEVFKKKKNKK